MKMDDKWDNTSKPVKYAIMVDYEIKQNDKTFYTFYANDLSEDELDALKFMLSKQNIAIQPVKDFYEARNNDKIHYMRERYNQKFDADITYDQMVFIIKTKS